MEPYFKKNIFVESMVVLPEHLDSNLYTKLEQLLTKKYPQIYFDKGYIFNIKIIKILDNKITLTGQIVLKVEFEADIYTPQVGHIFEGKVKHASSNKFRWIEIEPLKIFLESKNKVELEDKVVNVQITNIKSDNTFCFGKLI